MLTIYIDFKSADSYLALKPSLSLAERLDLDVEWRPFRSVPRELPASSPDRRRTELHHRVRTAARRREQQTYARHQGLELRFRDPEGSSDLALGVLAALEGPPLSFVRRAFEAYWSEGANLDDEAEVSRLIDDPRALSLAREALAVAQEAAERAGIVDAPAYVVHGQIFVGRQHLPWVEELVREKL